MERFRADAQRRGWKISPCSRPSRTSCGSAWTDWDPTAARARAALRSRSPRATLAERIEFVVFCQFLFFEQWAAAARTRRRALGIGIIGDIPIFVAHDSADVWANQHLFKLDDQRPAAGRRGRAARLLQRHRPALGQSAVRLGRHGRRRLRVVDRPLPPSARAGRPGAHRSLPRLRGGLGGARRRHARRSTAHGSSGPGSAVVRRHRRRRSAAASRRSSPRTSG